MRAVHITEDAEVELVDLPEPEPGPKEVLVRVERAALCATDHKMAGRGQEPAIVPGHEAVGRLEDGTLVGVHPDVGCGRCRHCRAGVETRCPNRRSVGVDRDGGFAEYVTVRWDHAVPIPDVDPAFAPVLEPLACCLHAIVRLDVEPGMPALVVGGGVMGVLNMWALQAAGCAVVLSEPVEERRELAMELGADAVVAPGGDPAQELGAHPQVAVVTAPSDAALRDALQQVDVGGAVHAFAGLPDEPSIDPNVVHYRHLRLVGTTGSDIVDYERAHRLVATGRIDLSRLPIDVIGLDDVPDRLGGDRPTEKLKTLVDVRGETDGA